MEMIEKMVSLEEISEDYPIILIDNCALVGYQQINGSVNVDSNDFFKKYIDEGMKIYVTPSTFREYSYLEGPSSFRRKGLLDSIQSNSRIIHLDNCENSLYSELSEKNLRIKNKFGLGFRDYDYVLSAVVITKIRKQPVALISNDTGILRAWKFFLMEENLSLEELSFLVRAKNKAFKKIEPPKNYKKI